MNKEEFSSKLEDKINNKTKHLTKKQILNFHKSYLEYHKNIKPDEILVIPIEEMAELTQHLSKVIRNKESSNDLGILEEMVDVQICLDNLRLYFGITDEKFQYAMDVKFERNMNNINKGNA